MGTCGRIDLDSDNSVVGLTGEQNKVRYRKRLTKDFPIILEALSLYRHALQGLVVEPIFNWYWLVDGLLEAGFNQLILALRYPRHPIPVRPSCFSGNTAGYSAAGAQ